MRAQGWYPDPYDTHDDRWFSDGKPTNLVRDHGTESYDEPPQGQLPVNPVDRDEAVREGPPRQRPSQAGEPEWPIMERRPWRWWTVCLPGVLALAVSSYVFMLAVLAYALNDCFDSCGSPAPPPGASPLAVQEAILFVAVFVSLLVGVAVPAWRRLIALALWAAVALPVALVPLNGLWT
jgi:hypothetical protein